MVLLAGCVVITSDGVAKVTFEGREYTAGSATGYKIEAGDLAPIGTASAVGVAVDGYTVFALKGVPSQEIAVMKAAADQDSGYMILFYGERAIRRPGEVPGICQYVDTAPIQGCPVQSTQ